MSRIFPDLSPIVNSITRIAEALEGIDRSLNRIVEIVDRPVEEYPMAPAPHLKDACRVGGCGFCV